MSSSGMCRCVDLVRTDVSEAFFLTKNVFPDVRMYFYLLLSFLSVKTTRTYNYLNIFSLNPFFVIYGCQVTTVYIHLKISVTLEARNELHE
jgi:hypothetical protein